MTKLVVRGLTVLLSMLLIASCSNGGREPLVPEVSIGESPCQGIENMGRSLFGMWNLTVDPEAMTVEAIPERNLQARVALTNVIHTLQSQSGFKACQCLFRVPPLLRVFEESGVFSAPLSAQES